MHELQRAPLARVIRGALSTPSLPRDYLNDGMRRASQPLELESIRELLPAFIRRSSIPIRAPARTGGELPWPGSATSTSVAPALSVSPTSAVAPIAGLRRIWSSFASSRRPLTAGSTGASSERPDDPHHPVRSRDSPSVVVGHARGGLRRRPPRQSRLQPTAGPRRRGA